MNNQLVAIIILSILFIVSLFVYSNNLPIFYILLGVLFSGVIAIVTILVQEVIKELAGKKEQATELLFLYNELDNILGDVLLQSTWTKGRHVDVGYLSSFCQSNYKKYSLYSNFLKILFYINHIYCAYNKYDSPGLIQDPMWNIKYQKHMGDENLIGSTQTLMEEIEKTVKEKDNIFYINSLVSINSFHHQIRKTHPPLDIKNIIPL